MVEVILMLLGIWFLISIPASLIIGRLLARQSRPYISPIQSSSGFVSE